MKKIVILIFIFTFNCAHFVIAQTNTVARARIETMFKSFTPGTVEPAINAFAKGSLIPPQLVDQISSQTKNILTVERPIVGFEFVGEQNVGESVTRLSYVLKLSDRPLFWNFSFYKPTNDWVPLRIYFSEEP